MRFIIAICAFVLAACFIAVGVAQRTIFLQAPTVSHTVIVKTKNPYIEISDSALTAFKGDQLLTVSGPAGVFLAYGRESDVRAWIGGDTSSRITWDKMKHVLTQKTIIPKKSKPDDAASTETKGEKTLKTPQAVTPDPAQTKTPVVSPLGSDLWFEQYSGKRSLQVPLGLRKGISVIVASGEDTSAPQEITISWPVDTSTPSAGPLILGGFFLLILGGFAYMWAVLHSKKLRGPRRNQVKRQQWPGKNKRHVSHPFSEKGDIVKMKNRKSTKATFALLVCWLPVVLSSCGVQDTAKPGVVQNGQNAQNQVDSKAQGTVKNVIPVPAMTEAQVKKLVARLAKTVSDADATLAQAALEPRLSHIPLDIRKASYTVKAALPDHKLPYAIPSSPVALILPQQTQSWPRTVLAVVKNSEDTTVPPLTLVMVQESPRQNYTLRYAIPLQAKANIPEVAPADVGAPAIAPDSKLLVIAPNQLAKAYGDILIKGDLSEFLPLFTKESDTLRTQSATDKQKRQADVASNASIEFSTEPGIGPPLSFVTNNSGAIVAVNLIETEVAKPKDGGLVGNQNAAKVLSGIEKSAKGTVTRYATQLLFYVPASGSDEKISLLGWVQALLSAKELE